MIILFISISCKTEINSNESQKIESATSLKTKSKETDPSDDNFISHDSIFYILNFEELKIDSSGQFTIEGKEFNVLDVTKLRLGIDNEEEWERGEFPSDVFKFKNIEYLWIGMRGFKEFPPGISSLKKLKHIDLQHGNIRKLPDDFYLLENLENLTLLFSNISELPPNFEKLKNLKRLNLGCTKIDHIPDQILKMHNLEILLLTHDDECQGKRKIFSEKDKVKVESILKNTKVGIGRKRPIE